MQMGTYVSSYLNSAKEFCMYIYFEVIDFITSRIQSWFEHTSYNIMQNLETLITTPKVIEMQVQNELQLYSSNFNHDQLIIELHLLQASQLSFYRKIIEVSSEISPIAQPNHTSAVFSEWWSW